MASLKDLTAVITGASSGIGRAIAEELAGLGVHLHLLGRDRARLAAAVDGCRAHGVRAEGHAADLTDDGALALMVDKLGSVDILVHSAGVADLGKLAESGVDVLDHHYQVNLRAPYALTRALLPALLEAKGQVVFINSGAGLNARVGWGAYAISKFGLRAFADALRDEVKPAGVRVLTAYPGRTATPMQAHVRAQEGVEYDPSGYIQPADVSAVICNALALPRSADVIEVNIRQGT